MTVLAKSVRLALLAVGLSMASIVWAEPPANLDARINAVIKQYGVPGMAVAIVENGKTVHAKGYGVRRLGSTELVDADTIFQTGSTGKAVTTAALAVLVDEGKLDWDDKVIDRLPGFQMYDPWVTREITIRDLLVHRSGLGLGAGDLLAVPRTSLTRAETVKRLRYIKPATSFRSGYAYDNVLYMVAGAVIEAVSGQTWEDFVRDRVLKPAGMRSSTTTDAARLATPNRAQPHARMNGGFRGNGDQELLDERMGLGANLAPAGGISSSASDMAHWLAIQLAHGALPGDGKARLFSEESSKQMWTPQVIMPISQFPAPVEEATPQFSEYALGWDVQDYRGVKILSHGGAVFGVQTMVVLMPKQGVGFSLQINSEDSIVLLGLMYELLDHYLDAPEHDWVAGFAELKKAKVAGAMAALSASKTEKKPSRPSLPSAGYAGNYVDPWYGPISVRMENDKLRIDFKQTPNMGGTLEHWQYDTFTTTWDDRTIEPAYVSFSLDADGKVANIRMKPVSPIADFSYDYQDLLFTPAP